MIGKQDILDRAGEWQLRPDIVEKDYILGWLLTALFRHPETSSNWIFKGGTCLKKCYFETYRFSEDLDFSLLPDALYAEEEIRRVLAEVARSASELCGIELPEAEIRIESLKDKQGNRTLKGRVYYRGPLGRTGLSRVLFDLTRYEELADNPAHRQVFHPYGDQLPEELRIQAYSLDELLAEKTRALYERTRPRDLYDVIYILENRAEDVNLDHVRTIFEGKCRAKGFEPPNTEALIRVIESSEELRSEWSNMLAHQLPELPPIESMVDRSRLTGILRWIEEVVVLPAARLAAASMAAGEEVVAPAGIQYWGGDSVIERLRFAGANRLRVSFIYNGRQREVEPYSLRRAATGNLLFYGWDQGSGHIKAFNVPHIQQLRVTQSAFAPRYRVELATGGPVYVSAVGTRPKRYASRPRVRSFSSYRSPVSRGGPTYVFQCPYCQKKFYHKRNDPTLRKHKSQSGWGDCSGRRGSWVETKY